MEQALPVGEQDAPEPSQQAHEIECLERSQELNLISLEWVIALQSGCMCKLHRSQLSACSGCSGVPCLECTMSNDDLRSASCFLNWWCHHTSAGGMLGAATAGIAAVRRRIKTQDAADQQHALPHAARPLD